MMVRQPDTEAMRRLLEPSSALLPIRVAVAEAAQRVYNDWQQDETGHDDVLGFGGICDQIASEMSNVLGKTGLRCLWARDELEEHARIVVACRDGIFTLDIPADVYEFRLAIFDWRKKPNIDICADDVLVELLDREIENLFLYNFDEDAVAADLEVFAGEMPPTAPSYGSVLHRASGGADYMAVS